MSGQNSSEEKTLPATEHSLRKAREKGQIASSREFVTMLVTLGGLIYALTAWPSFVGIFQDGLAVAVYNFNADFGDSYQQIFIVAILEPLRVLAPLVAILLIMTFLSNILHKKGIPFSFHPVIPDFSKISMASGFKKIFGVRGMVEFAISLLKLLLWFAVAVLFVWLALPAVLNSPICEAPCALASAGNLLTKLIIAAVVMMLLGGILDLPLQKALFLREQKMSRTQFKRELKETTGSPEYKGLRKETHRRLTQTSSTAAPDAPASIVISGSDTAIALRFNAQDTPVPIVIARGQGTHADDIVRSAGKLKIPVEHQPDLALDLYRTTIAGQQIEERLFQPVALLIVKNGLL